MSIWVECTRYNSDEKLMLNLEVAQSITATNYLTARSIVTFPGMMPDESGYYVKESYEDLSAIIRAAHVAKKGG